MGNTKSLVSLSTNLLASVGVFTLPRKVSNVTPIDSAVDVGLQSAELGA